MTVEQAGGKNIRKSYVIGNWKSYKRFQEAKVWLDTFAQMYVPHDNVEVVLSPTFLCLEHVRDYLADLGLQHVSLAAQDVSPYPKGAYTGAIAADLLSDLVDYVIVGHSERRRYFRETSNDIGNKVSAAVEAGMTPLVCVDQPYAMSQLTALNDIDTDQVLLAYGPVDALTCRVAQKPAEVLEAVHFIKQVHPQWPIVYGGAITSENVKDYTTLDGLAGVFCGSASLDPHEFHAIFSAVVSARSQRE